MYGQHAQGTEVKAITYSNMQIFMPGGRIYTAGDDALANVGAGNGSASGGDARPTGPAELQAAGAPVEDGAEDDAGVDGLGYDALVDPGAVSAGAAQKSQDGPGEGRNAVEGDGDRDPLRPTGRRRGAFDIYVIVDI